MIEFEPESESSTPSSENYQDRSSNWKPFLIIATGFAGGLITKVLGNTDSDSVGMGIAFAVVTFAAVTVGDGQSLGDYD